jgi:hypothetical protein
MPDARVVLVYLVIAYAWTFALGFTAVALQDEPIFTSLKWPILGLVAFGPTLSAIFTMTIKNCTVRDRCIAACSSGYSIFFQFHRCFFVSFFLLKLTRA